MAPLMAVNALLQPMFPLVLPRVSFDRYVEFAIAFDDSNFQFAGSKQLRFIYWERLDLPLLLWNCPFL